MKVLSGISFKDRINRSLGRPTTPEKVTPPATSIRELAARALAEVSTDEDDDIKMDKLYRVIQRQVNKGFILREAVPHMVFLSMVLTVIFVTRAEDNQAQVHRMVEGITGNLLGTGFRNTDDMRFHKVFGDISSDVEWWDWLESPLAASLWPDRDSNPYGLLQTYLKPLRYVIIRQVRVKASRCSHHEAFHFLTPSVQLSLPPMCYPDYHCDLINCNVDTAPFGSDRVFMSLDSDNSSSSGLDLQPIIAQMNNYDFPGKSFAVVLDTDTQNYTQVLDEIQQLRKSGWVDGATRFLSVELVTLDRNFDVFTWAALSCEITAGGLWIPQSRIIPFKFMRLDSVAGVFVFIFDIFISFQVAYVLYRLVQGIFRHYRLHKELLGYFRFWNVYTISGMTLFAVTYGYRWFFWHLTISDVGYNSDTAEDTLQMWSKLCSYSRMFETSWNLYGFATLLALGGTTRFLQYNQRLSVVFETIERALGELLVVCLLLAMTVFAFGLLGHILFGYYINEFQSFIASCGTLLRMLPGDYPDAMFFTMRGAQNNTIAATIFLLMYFTTSWIVLLNLVIGVLGEAFAVIKERVGPPEFDFFTSIQAAVNGMMGMCIPSRRAEKRRQQEEKDLNKAAAAAEKEIRGNVYGKLKIYKRSGYWQDRMKKKELQELQLDPENGDLTWAPEEWEFLLTVMVENVHDVCDRAVESEEHEMLQKIYAACMQIMAASAEKGTEGRESTGGESMQAASNLLEKLRLSRPSQCAPRPTAPSNDGDGPRDLISPGQSNLASLNLTQTHPYVVRATSETGNSEE